MIIRLALGIVVVAIPFLLLPGQSYACKCAVPGSPSEELEQSAAVFEGRVVSVQEPEDNDIKGSNLVVFEVNAVWKGPSQQEARLQTNRTRESCGFAFVEGESYLVYSHDGAGVNTCSRTRLLSEAAEDLSQLGSGQTLPAGELPGPDGKGGGCGAMPFATDLSIVGLMVGVLWFSLRRRSFL